MAVRIHFTAADLARTHVSAEPDPLWETVLSWHVLYGEYPRWRYPQWRRILPSGRGRVEIIRLVGTRLLPLAPPGPYFPDFLTPTEGLAGFDAGLEAVLATPRARVRSELSRLHPSSPSARWVSDVADGDAATWRELRAAFSTYFEQAIAPHWAAIRAWVRAEYTLRSRAYADNGVDGLLAGLRPMMRWEPPVLEVAGPGDRDVELGGRGLTLIPSYFNSHNPIGTWDPQLPPVVVYPAARLGSVVDVPHRSSALADLLGRTRASALEAVALGCTTTELAQAIGVSSATASEHAKVLRGAGLVMTQRHRQGVWHTTTALGAALLNAPPNGPSDRPLPGASESPRPSMIT